jgi:azurin/glucose/arabinose dehydrogenase
MKIRILSRRALSLFGSILLSCLAAERGLAQISETVPLLPLEKGDHVAIVGSGLAERQQHSGWLEALIHRAYPQLNLTVRNLGFSADEVDVHPRSADAPPLEYFLSMKTGDTQLPGSPAVYQAGRDFGAQVILAYWGFNESFRGPENLEKFKGALGAWIDAQLTANYSGKGPPRLVLFSPIAHENLKDPNLPDGSANNANLSIYTEAMAAVAKEKGVPFIDLFHASMELYRVSKTSLTFNGVHLTNEGDKALAPVQFRALFGEEAPSLTDPLVIKIREAVLDKNQEWHRRYRTVDQYNIYGERSRISYVGVTNSRILNQEMAQRDVKASNRDQRIWAVANGSDLVVKDDNLPPVESVPSNREDSPPYLDPEEAIQYLITPPGVKVELIASEKTHPELVNPMQMAFDTKGRLWVAVWKNYPEASPTTTDFDKLLVFDLDPATGKVAKMTTFLDGLNCPTGFQFYKDGVIVFQSPDMWFVRDTDGDGKGDWKERLLSGLDAADSHHATNSMVLEPGGAMYPNDGAFLSSNTETPYGPVRNENSTIYRYEPLTGKLTRHIPFNPANPHGRVFDDWGNDFFTEATGNDTFFGPAMSGHLDEGAHPAMRTFWNRPARPCAGTAILSSRHFPDEWQGQFLNANVIGIQGIMRANMIDEGSGVRGETTDHLVAADVAKHPNFRPSGMTVAPDGSIYFMDWSQMLIGHLQHHLRDPKRDQKHGRLYRITYEGRPLLVPKRIYGEPIEALLELLKEPENDVRTRAKIELGKHDARQVTSAAKAWVAKLDKNDPRYAHHVLEGLWVHQWHNVVDLNLLIQVLNSTDPRARAQGVRVLGYWRDRVPEPLSHLREAAEDEAPRVRLEAVRVASFFRDWRAADVALASLKYQPDYYLEYCLHETMRQLRPWWSKALADAQPIASGNEAGLNYMVASMGSSELLTLPKTTFTLTTLLARDDLEEAQRQQMLADLVEIRKEPPARIVVEAIRPIAAIEGRASAELSRVLATLPVSELKSERDALVALGGSSSVVAVRQGALAARVRVDGSLEEVWSMAKDSPAALMDFLAAMPMVEEAPLKAAAAAKVMSLLEGRADPNSGIRVAAIQCLASLQQDPKSLFRILADLLAKGELVPVVSKAVGSIPSEAWDAANAGPAVKGVLTWASELPARERAGSPFLDVVQVGESLARLLPQAEAEVAIRTFKDLTTPLLIVATVPGEMRYDQSLLVVKAGKPFLVTLKNPDAMAHNIVFVAPDSAKAVAESVQTQAPDKLDAQGRAYVPIGDPRVFAASKMIEPAKEETIEITAPAEEGTYEFVCTFPGHWMIMKGKLVVTKDVDAYLKANPVVK